MTAAEDSLALGELHILEQEGRIERQEKLIAQFENERQAAFANKARGVLMEMYAMLESMKRDVASARERVRMERERHSDMDEDSLVRVMLDCPL
jgi:hypothetical protein